MAHIKDRLCLVPFCDLADCPNITQHHAIGSPHFTTLGHPTFPDPIVIAVKADLVDPELPRSTALTASCSTRPSLSYGPLIRAVFENSKPNLHQDLRNGIEGVMELGQIRVLPPGALEGQISQIVLACIGTMTTGTNDTILKQVMENIAAYFHSMGPGSTMRIPLIGTGESRPEKTTDETFQNVLELLLSSLLKDFFGNATDSIPRRALLVHPSSYEAQMVTSLLAKKSIFHTILDKLGLSTTDKRQVYGIAHGEYEKHQIVQIETFDKALEHFDQAVVHLLAGNRRDAVKEAARGAEVEPSLSGMFHYLDLLSNKQRGLIESVTQEALKLAEQGRIQDAYQVAQRLKALDGKEPEHKFISSLRRCYIGYSLAEIEGQMLYEKYTQAEESQKQLSEKLQSYDASTTGEEEASNHRSQTSSRAEAVLELKNIQNRIPQMIVNNTFHVAIRKLLAEPIKPQSIRRVMDSLSEWKAHHDLPISAEEEETIGVIHLLVDKVEQELNHTERHELNRMILDQLQTRLSNHSTYRLEEARFHLQGGPHLLLSRHDLESSWKHLKAGLKHNTEDYGILSYIGFLILMQGPEIYPQAETFFSLWHRLIEREIMHGKYRIHQVESPCGTKVQVPIFGQNARKAYSYQESWLTYVHCMVELVKGLNRQHSGEMLLNRYNQATQGLKEVGRYDLAQLYKQHLGETWISLFASRKRGGVKIPIPGFGEISLDMLVQMYRRFRRWMLFRNLKSDKLKEAMEDLLTTIDRSIQKSANTK